MPSCSTHLGEVVYNVAGEGPAVILLHATLHDRQDFDGIIPALSKSYQTIAVDWPYHGESKGSTPRAGESAFARVGAADLADVLEEVVASLALPPAVIIGNSVGGFAAARLAIRSPQYVRALVLVNSGGFGTWTTANRFFCRSVLGNALIARRVLPSLLIPRYMACQNDLDIQIARRAAERAATVEGAATAASMWRSFPDSNADLRAEAQNIKVPTLIVWGKKDIVFPPKAGQEVQECIPGSDLEFLDSGHVVFASKSKEFLLLVEPFLAKVFQDES